MLRITDPSIGPPGGSFRVKNPKTGNEFAHPNPNVVYYYFRKDCEDNNLPVLDPYDIETLICEQHPEVCSDKIRGLGDLVEKVAHPIAKALGLPCLDQQTQQLKKGSPCWQRRNALNKAVPF